MVMGRVIRDTSDSPDINKIAVAYGLPQEEILDNPVVRTSR